MRPDTVGSIEISSRFTLVAAPVLAELKIGLLSAETTMVSATCAGPRAKVRSCVTPRLSMTSCFSSVWNPCSTALTV